MSEKLTKEEQMKLKIKKQQEERDARKALMSRKDKDQHKPEEQQKVNVKVDVEGNEQYTITIDQLVLKLKNPEQTFGMKAQRTELIGCFFEPEVAKVFKDDQKKKGRGWQSHLVNELVKQYYQDKGKL